MENKTNNGKESPWTLKAEAEEQIRLLTVDETAKLLKISPRSIYNQGDAFPIKFIRINRLIRFRMKDIEAFLDSA